MIACRAALVSPAVARLASPLLAAAALAGACGWQGDPVATGAPGLRAEERVLSEQASDCVKPVGPCASMVVRYPEFVSAPNETVRAALNRFIRETLLEPTFTDRPAGSLQARLAQFRDAYAEFRQAFPEAPARWTVEQQASVRYQDDRVVTLAVVESSYTGGAHPNERRTLASFDLETGERVALDRLFVEGFEEPLREAGERAFRAARQLAPEESLADAGFTFENDRFHLPGEFGMVGEGLLFQFDAYEVGPYALGPTEFLVPIGEIGSYAREGGLLDGLDDPGRLH
jgi:hypothetical protein